MTYLIANVKEMTHDSMTHSNIHENNSDEPEHESARLKLPDYQSDYGPSVKLRHVGYWLQEKVQRT